MQLQCRFWHLSPGTNKQTHRCRNTLARARALVHRRCLHIFLPTEQQSTHMCAITHTQAKAVLSGWSIVSCAGEGWWLQTAVKAPRTRGWHPLSTEQGEMSNTGSGAPSLSLHTAPPHIRSFSVRCSWLPSVAPSDSDCLCELLSLDLFISGFPPNVWLVLSFTLLWIPFSHSLSSVSLTATLNKSVFNLFSSLKYYGILLIDSLRGICF